jgi:hypothetical protein
LNGDFERQTSPRKTLEKQFDLLAAMEVQKFRIPIREVFAIA